MKVFGAIENVQIEWFTDAGKPSAASNPYRVIYVTDLKEFQISDGSAWLKFQPRSSLPTVQIITSGSGTYTTPSNARFIEIEMVGGGGGGSGSGNGTSGGTGGTGGNTTFGTSLLTANGGVGGACGGLGGTGGSVTINSPATRIFSIAGTQGGSSSLQTNVTFLLPSGAGGQSFFSGGGSPSFSNTAGVAGIANSGSGGSGGGCGSGASSNVGSGGGSGGYIRAFITSPSATYSYAIGAGGTAGTAGTNGTAGGAGGSGIIIVREYY